MFKSVDRDIFYSGILGFQIILVFYLIWFISNMDTLEQGRIFLEKCKKLNFDNPFPTFVYSLLISSARTKNDVLAFDKKEFRKNDWQRFVKDLHDGHINTIILAGRAYQIKFKNEDMGYVYFQTISMCSTLQLPSCNGFAMSENERKNNYIKSNISIELKNLLNQIVHVFGCKM